MTVAPARLDGAQSWFKRLLPLLFLAAAVALVLAMGWQHYLTLNELAYRRNALQAAIDSYPLLTLLAYIVFYAVSVALSLPGGAVLTTAGGFLFGWLLGGIAAVVAATAGAVLIFLVAKSALGEPLAARAGLRLQLPAVLAPFTDFPILAGQSCAGFAWSAAIHLRACDLLRHHPCHFCLCSCR
jgi:hypothetical protein